MKVLSKLNSLDNVNDGDTRKLITKTSGSGTGNVVSSISVSGDTISYTKGVNALTNHQNTFSTVKVGNTNVAADKAGDTLELAVGSNITLTPDATNNKVTIAATVPTKTSELDNDMNFMSGMTILAYGKSTWNDFITAYTAKHVVYARASSSSNPASGSQTRMAFMAYVNNETNPTEVEFQYYRSVSSHSATQQGDQVYVYKLNKTKGWSVTIRECYTKVVGGTDITGTWSNGTLTLDHDNSGVTAGTYKSVTVDATGHVTAGTNPTTLSGYGITDAKIENGTITLGSNTITPLTSYTEINSNLVNGSATGSLRTISSTEESANYTIGQNALAHGVNTKASGEGSHSEGYFSTASGQYSHAEGSSCSSSGLGSHAEGAFAYANGDSSHAEGYHVIASTPFQHVQGKYNVADLNDTYAHIVGGGTSNTQKNIHTLTWKGEAWYQGDVYVGSTSGTNKDAGSKKLLKEGDVTDTKNTAGSTNSSSTLYLIGATSQAANPQTYSNSRLYYSSGLHSGVSTAGGSVNSTFSQTSNTTTISEDDSYDRGEFKVEVNSVKLSAKNYDNNKTSTVEVKSGTGVTISSGVGVTINNLVAPTNNTDAANKQYVDNAVASITPTIPNATSTTVGGIKMRLDTDTNTLYITNDGSNA